MLYALLSIITLTIRYMTTQKIKIDANESVKTIGIIKPEKTEAPFITVCNYLVGYIIDKITSILLKKQSRKPFIYKELREIAFICTLRLPVL